MLNLHQMQGSFKNPLEDVYDEKGQVCMDFKNSPLPNTFINFIFHEKLYATSSVHLWFESDPPCEVRFGIVHA